MGFNCINCFHIIISIKIVMINIAKSTAHFVHSVLNINFKIVYPTISQCLTDNDYCIIVGLVFVYIKDEFVNAVTWTVTIVGQLNITIFLEINEPVLRFRKIKYIFYINIKNNLKIYINIQTDYIILKK